MNILLDKWIPVITKKASMEQLSLEQLLCNEGDWEIVHHRDDMELAALEICISLVQSIFKVNSEEQLKLCLRQPLNNKDYQKAVKEYVRWFDLKELQFPFLQTRGLNSKDVVPIQKLFNGLPEGNNHTWHYNAASRISQICASCAVIALFNQATSTPSFGGGFKNPLRGAAPITTLLKGRTLRETIWLNVLSQGFISRHYPTNTVNIPNWVVKVEKGQDVEAAKFGLLRGLFWQPALIELVWQQPQTQPQIEVQQKQIICDSCGVETKESIIGFKRQKFDYKLVSDFLHPHSPRVSVNKKGEQITFYNSFNDSRPSWTQLAAFVFEQKQKDTQTLPALVIEQYREIFPNQQLNLIVGGYINNQAKIIERRHESFSLTEKLNSEEIQHALLLGVEIGNLVRGKAYGLGLSANLDKLSGGSLGNIVSDLQGVYYSKSESIVHSLIARINSFEDKEQAIDEFISKLTRIGDELLVDFASGYQTMNNHLNASRKTLNAAITKLSKSKKETVNV